MTIIEIEVKKEGGKLGPSQILLEILDLSKGISERVVTAARMAADNKNSRKIAIDLITEAISQIVMMTLQANISPSLISAVFYISLVKVLSFCKEIEMDVSGYVEQFIEHFKPAENVYKDVEELLSEISLVKYKTIEVDESVGKLTKH